VVVSADTAGESGSLPGGYLGLGRDWRRGEVEAEGIGIWIWDSRGCVIEVMKREVIHHFRRCVGCGSLESEKVLWSLGEDLGIGIMWIGDDWERYCLRCIVGGFIGAVVVASVRGGCGRDLIILTLIVNIS